MIILVSGYAILMTSETILNSILSVLTKNKENIYIRQWNIKAMIVLVIVLRVLLINIMDKFWFIQILVVEL